MLALAREQAGDHEPHLPGIAELVARRTELDAPMTEVMQSLIHMHLNRVLGPRQIEQEVVIYDYLRRFCRSEVARDRRVLSVLGPDTEDDAV